MATPVGHFLVGLAITQGMAGSGKERKQGIALAALAVLPDVDLVVGLFVGNIWAFHRGASHSIAVAMAFGITALAALALFKVRRPLHTAAMLFLVYLSHLVLDSMMVDTGEHGSVPFFWPWLDTVYKSPVSLLPSGNYHISELLSLKNVAVVLQETLIFLPLTALVITLRQAGAPLHKWMAWPRRAAWVFAGWFAVAVVASAALN